MHKDKDPNKAPIDPTKRLIFLFRHIIPHEVLLYYKGKMLSQFCKHSSRVFKQK